MKRILLLATLSLGCVPIPAIDLGRPVAHPAHVQVRMLPSGRLEVAGGEGAVVGARSAMVTLVAPEGGLIQAQLTEVTPFGSFLAEVSFPRVLPSRDLRLVVWPVANGKTAGESATVSIP